VYLMDIVALEDVEAKTHGMVYQAKLRVMADEVEVEGTLGILPVYGDVPWHPLIPSAYIREVGLRGNEKPKRKRV